MHWWFITALIFVYVYCTRRFMKAWFHTFTAPCIVEVLMYSIMTPHGT